MYLLTFSLRLKTAVYHKIPRVVGGIPYVILQTFYKFTVSIEDVGALWSLDYSQALNNRFNESS